MNKKKHVHINTKFDIDTYLMQSSMKYNQRGQMRFDDALYLTQWLCADKAMKSETHFTRASTESFIITREDFDQHMEWSQFGFVQNFSDALTGQYSSPFHRNTHLELYYLIDGEFRIKVQKDIITLKPGEALILNQNTLHSDILGANKMDLRIIGLNENYFNKTFYNSLKDEKLKRFIKHCFETKNTESEYWYFREVRAIETVIQAIQKELTNKEIEYETMIQAHVLRLFHHLEHNPNRIQNKETSHGFKALVFNEVDQYIQVNYATVTLNDLSNFMKFSKDYFNRLIKEVSGLTYVQYLQKVRIDNALRLLDESDSSVMEVAQTVGYQNTSHFYDIFKNQVGLTPNEYRRKRTMRR